jgi:hypothetical protein
LHKIAIFSIENSSATIKVVVEDSPLETKLVAMLLPKLNYSAAIAIIQEIVDPTPPETPKDLPDELDTTSLLEALHVTFCSTFIYH